MTAPPIVGMKYDRQGKKGGDTPWRRRPDKSQPFFSKIDFGECHSSVTKTAENVIVQKRLNRLNRLQPGDFHDPAKASVPSFHPDDPIFRRSWARYYDAVTQVDYWTPSNPRPTVTRERQGQKGNSYQ